MAVLLVLIGAVLPMAIAPHLLFHYDATPKTLLLCIALLVALSRMREIPSEMAALWSRAGGRMFTILALASITWAGVSTAFSTQPTLSVVGSGWREFGFATIATLIFLSLLVAAHLCIRPDRITLLLRASTVAGLVVSLYGIAQYFDLDPFQTSAGYHALDGDSVVVRPPGTFGHADYFGWWLAIDFFCALAVRKTQNRLWKGLGTTAGCVIAIAAILTGTRSSLLAIALGCIALFSIHELRFRARHLVRYAIAASVFALFLFSPPGQRLRARIVWAEHEPTGGGRPLLWRDSLRMGIGKPLTGFGPETFYSAFAQSESEELAQLRPDFHHESPHNVVLDALTVAGIPGVMLMLAWGFVAFRAAARTVRRDSETKVSALLAAGILASAIAGMFTAAIMPPLLLTLLMLGAIVAAEQPEPVSRPVSGLVLAGAGIPVAVCVAVFVCLLAASDYRLALFQNHPGVNQYASLLRLPVPIAAEDIYCSRALSSLCRNAGSGTAQMECWRTATTAAARATRTADDSANAWYNLAQFTAAQNDISGTGMALDRAIAAAPNWFKPHWAKAALLAQTGDAGHARQEARQAEILDANHTPEFSGALAQLAARIER